MTTLNSLSFAVALALGLATVSTQAAEPVPTPPDAHAFALFVTVGAGPTTGARLGDDDVFAITLLQLACCEGCSFAVRSGRRLAPGHQAGECRDDEARETDFQSARE